MKQLLYIGNRLSKHGINKTAIETLGPLLENEGFSVKYASNKKSKILRIFDMLRKVLQHSGKTDFVLIDTYSTSNFWYAVIISQLCRLLSLKYIPILHGGNLPNRLQNNEFLSDLIFKNAFINIAPSNYLLKSFSDHGFSNIAFIPNSIEINLYKFNQRNTLEPKLLWVRAFADIYNPEMALNVLNHLKIKYPDAVLCMTGPDKGEFQRIQKLAAAQNLNVTFNGKLSREEWTEMAENYDIFLNTTHFDNTPVSVIEAMALGLPIVSTNVGGIPYLLEDQKTALLVMDNDYKAMADSIMQIIENHNLSENLIVNSKKLADSFDWNQIKHKWFEILKE